LACIVSGGQTGVDRGALDAALELGFPCGGWRPPKRKAEDGGVPDRYPVFELKAGGYRRRTIGNILDSDGTLVIGFGPPEGGTVMTIQQCDRLRKPHLWIDAIAVPTERARSLVVDFVAEHRIVTLNVAGPRASKEPRGHAYAHIDVLGVLRSVIDGRGEPA
jgi:hypothetical protein